MRSQATRERNCTVANDYLLDWLDAFNRKERYYLIKQALGDFELDPGFRTTLGSSLGLEIPEASFVAMDYHLDWVYASLAFRGEAPTSEKYEEKTSIDFKYGTTDPTAAVHVNDNPEDIDLLVAFASSDTMHLIFIEAKGDTSWSTNQMWSKLSRLKSILGDHPFGVEPTLLLVSPEKRNPNDLIHKRGKAEKEMRLPLPPASEMPLWATSDGHWRYLPLEGLDGRRKISRSSKGEKWSVR